MFEVHGWATIRFTAENREREDEEELQDAAVERVKAHVYERRWSFNPWMDVRVLNGEAHFWVDGFRSHAGARDELLNTFRYIAQVAPGSYGLLYLQDDEDPKYGNEFRVYVLARGALTEHADPFLSPFFPVVEDPYSESEPG